jgi:hypothetical protein
MTDEGHEGSAIMFMLGITQLIFSINMWEELSETLKAVFPTTMAGFIFLSVFLFIQEKRIKKWNLKNGYTTQTTAKFVRDKHGNIVSEKSGNGYWNLRMMALWFVTMLIGIPLIT